MNKTDIDLRTPNDDAVAIDFAVPMWDGPRSFAAFFDRQVLAGGYAVTAGNIADLSCNVTDSYNRDPVFSTLPDLSWVDIDLRIDFSGVIALVRTDRITNTNVCPDFPIDYRIQDLVGQTLPWNEWITDLSPTKIRTFFI